MGGEQMKRKELLRKEQKIIAELHNLRADLALVRLRLMKKEDFKRLIEKLKKDRLTIKRTRKIT